MELGEILSDALMYPLQNIKALVIYIILGIVLGIAIAGTLAGVVAGAAAQNFFALFGSGIIGLIVALFLGFVISGYELDIVSYAIQKNSDAPGVDPVSQFIKGVKYFVVTVVYMIIPIIITAILAVIFQHWVITIIGVILAIVFALALTMAQCRLAKTEDLGHALAIGDAIGDISRIGIGKVLLLIIIITVVSLILSVISGFISQWNGIVGGIVVGIVGTYMVFFAGRATGLLYSEI